MSNKRLSIHISIALLNILQNTKRNFKNSRKPIGNSETIVSKMSLAFLPLKLILLGIDLFVSVDVCTSPFKPYYLYIVLKMKHDLNIFSKQKIA